jgi:hypothetical protein
MSLESGENIPPPVNFLQYGIGQDHYKQQDKNVAFLNIPGREKVIHFSHIDEPVLENAKKQEDDGQKNASRAHADLERPFTQEQPERSSDVTMGVFLDDV